MSELRTGNLRLRTGFNRHRICGSKLSVYHLAEIQSPTVFNISGVRGSRKVV
jgi:hypothetical protein